MNTPYPHCPNRIHIVLAALLSCATTTTSNAVASVQFIGVEFKAGHPSLGESLADSVKGSDGYEEKALKEDADALNDMPDARVEIIGFTDDSECLGRECYELSLRRARVVYEWFLTHGVRRKNLSEPEGRGSEMAIDDNGTESGRQRNRRTEVNMIRPTVEP